MRRFGLAIALMLVAPYASSLGTSFTDTMPDGFVIRYHFAGTELYPDLDAPTTLKMVRDATRENYAEFLSWGLVGDWPGAGDVYVDDQQGAQCVACVSSSTAFQIHVSLATYVRLTTSPTTPASYPDENAAMRTIVGHEMFHNFQNAYVKPTSSANRMNAAYMEGLARAQETLHTYSWVSHQPASLVYSGTVNGCNNELAPTEHPAEFPPASPVQWVADAQLRDGPTTDQSYSACDFWLAWIGAHGIPGLVDLLEASPAQREKTGWAEERDLLASVTSTSVENELATFARAALTGHELAWGGFDWGEDLGRWQPPVLSPGASLTEHLSDGGMMGARLEGSAVVSASSTLPIALYRIDDAGAIAAVPTGSLVAGPAWVVAILPGEGADDVTLTAG